MAIGPDIEIRHENTNYFARTAMERGGVASLVTGASTTYPGDPANVCGYLVSPALAVPLGVLFPTTADYETAGTWPDSAKYGFYEFINRKVRLITSGDVSTNMIPAVTIAAGQPAYLAADGKISNVAATDAPRVGTWKTAKNSKGFALLTVELA